MKIVRRMSLASAASLFMATSVPPAFQAPEDPVVSARAQRAQAQGISEGDLPPVPRTIAEPPPLPAPETNYKDTRKGRAARSRKGRKHHSKRSHPAPKHVKKKQR